MQSLQKVVDDMNLAGYVHVDRYVAQLDARLEAALLKRLLAVRAFYNRKQHSMRGPPRAHMARWTCSVIH